MPKIADVAAELDLKQKSLTKTKLAFDQATADFKKIATAQQKAEEKAKSEKDSKKKKTYQDESHKLRADGEALLKKKEQLQKSIDSFETSVDKLTEQLKAMREGLVAFGKSRTDYLKWFVAEKAKLDALVLETDRYKNAAEAALVKAEKAVDEGKVIAAAEAAGEADKMAQFTKTAFDNLEKLIGSWVKVWDEQRNLAPSDFGIDGADVKVHAGITAQVYDTFKVGDYGRRDARENLEAAEKAAEEADVVCKSGGKSAKMYEEIVDKTTKLVATKVKEYEEVLGHGWGKIMIDDGARFRQEASMIDKNNPTTVARALKVAEQGRAAIPKALDACEGIVKVANSIVTKERGRIPEEFKRALKPKVDQLGMLMMRLIQRHQAVKAKHAVVMIALDALEDAAK